MIGNRDKWHRVEREKWLERLAPDCRRASCPEADSSIIHAMIPNQLVRSRNVCGIPQEDPGQFGLRTRPEVEIRSHLDLSALVRPFRGDLGDLGESGLEASMGDDFQRTLALLLGEFLNHPEDFG